MAWEYSEKLQELFYKALHQSEDSHFGEIKDYFAIGHHGSIECGDAITFYLKIDVDATDPLKDRIVQARYKTFGCTSAIASSEALCLIIENQKLNPLDALKITNQDIVRFLGGMPDAKLHCSVMGAEVLLAAVHDWAKRRGVPVENIPVFNQKMTTSHSEKIICECFHIGEDQLRKQIQEMNLKNIDEVEQFTRAGSACGSCIESSGGIYNLLEELWSFPISGDTSSGRDHDLAAKVELLLNTSIIPELKKRSWDLNLVEMRGNILYCQIEGGEEVRQKVEQLLREILGKNIVVIDI